MNAMVHNALAVRPADPPEFFQIFLEIILANSAFIPYNSSAWARACDKNATHPGIAHPCALKGAGSAG